MPSLLTQDAVRSYRTISPLPQPDACTSNRGGIFLLHFPSRRRAWTLSSLLPVGVRTFLHPAEAEQRFSGPLHTRKITARDRD